MNFKKDVVIRKLTPEMLNVINMVEIVWRIYNPNIEPTITSACEETPDRVDNTKHAEHQALDFRTRNISRKFRSGYRLALKHALGKGYDVVLKLKPPHIHVEYDPK